MNDSRARRCSTTREEAELRRKLFDGKITLRTFNGRYNKLMQQGLIKRNGKAIR